MCKRAPLTSSQPHWSDRLLIAPLSRSVAKQRIPLLEELTRPCVAPVSMAAPSRDLRFD